MISFFDTIYTRITGKNKFSSLLRFIVRRIANLFIPIYFNLFPRRKKIDVTKYGKEKVVVSLTSFPQRISSVWLVIECMLRQTVMPDVIILYLSIDQFPNEYKDIPSNLMKLVKNDSLLIRFVSDDLRSHKKYYYAFKEFNNDLVILVDDDLFYINTAIEKLISLHEKYPQSICCLRAHKIIRDEDGKIEKYNDWKICYNFEGPSSEIFHTSGGGTLYRPKLFTNELFKVDIFKKLCFNADDIWLNFHAYSSGIKNAKADYYTSYIPITSMKSEKLSTSNVMGGGNDKQLLNLIEYYNKDSQGLFKN